MRNAGIKVWVLTGDKTDTAKNIGYSCKLLVQKGMKVLEYPKQTEDLLKATNDLRNEQSKLKREDMKIGYVITGDHLFTIMKDPESELYQMFTSVALDSDVVLCCRVSPKQKQEIVAMVKNAVTIIQL